jgi:hypothetical protein
MTDLPKDDYLKNFAIMFPTTAVYQLRDCNIFGATWQEFGEFKAWFEGQHY